MNGSHRIPSAGRQVAWIAGAAVVGFVASAVFAGLLRLPRDLFLMPYAAVVTAFLYGHGRSAGVNVTRLFRERPLAGLLGAAVAGGFVVANVVSQPAFPRPEGWELVLVLLWVGVFYGTLDALFLSVMPVVAVRLAFSQAQPQGRLVSAATALAASLAVTSAYHLGFPGFRGAQLVGPIIGNCVLTLAYLATHSPLSPILGHAAMHIASVIHGMETTIQLPPHY